MTLPGNLVKACEEHESQVSILVDCGASRELVDREYISSAQLDSELVTLPQPLKLQTIDGVSTSENDIRHEIELTIRVGEQLFTQKFLVTKLAPEHPIVFGLSWFKRYNPDIDWSNHHIVEYRGEQPARRTLVEPCASYKDDTLPIAYGSSTNPELAFKAGGVISAIEAEEQRRQQALNQAKTLLQARSATIAHLENLNHVKAFQATINGLSRNEANWLDSIPRQYHAYAPTVFSDEEADKLPPHRDHLDCSIDIREGEKLSTCKIYDLSKEQAEILKAWIDEQLRKGFISHSQSPASSPVFFVKAPASDSRGAATLRLVIDYRRLNSKIKLNEYPIPLSRTVMERLPTAKIFTKFDVRVGFNNLRIKSGDEWKTAFKTMFGLYEYNVMPMGLATAPAFFQQFMNTILAPYLDIFCFAYLDDIIIFSPNEEEHEKHVNLVLRALEENNLHLKPSKCAWHKEEISFLGFTAVAGKGIRMSDDKIKALRDWEPPENVSDLRSFLGTVNFYSKMIPHFADIATSFTDKTKKGAVFEWNDDMKRTWKAFKEAIRSDVFVKAFDPKLPTNLETDASDRAYAGVITQLHPDGIWYPVLWYSHKFKDEETRWNIAEKELYAIVYAIKRYPYLLQPMHVDVYTDHRNLARFMLTTKLTSRLGRWYDDINASGVNFTIQYRPGNENTVADALSRYGMDAKPAGPEYAPLLPRARFSSKALDDIDSWAKPVVKSRKFGFSPLAYEESKKKSDPLTRLSTSSWDDLRRQWDSPSRVPRQGLGFVE